MRRRQSTGWSCSAPWPGALVALAGLLMSAPAAAPSGSIGGTALAQYVGSSHSGGHHVPAGYGATWGGSTAYHYGPKTGIGGGGFVPYYSYGLGLPYGPYYYGSFALGPVFVPADSLFGPGPLMAGIGNLVPADDGGMGNPPGARNRGPLAGPAPKNAGLQNAVPQNPLDPPAPKKVRATNAASKARAGKFLQSGDVQFAKQKFHQALERYREGSLAAPDLAECFFRQAFAQVAMGQYEAAAKAIQRGLRLKPDWADGQFSLVSLYGAEQHLIKFSHREVLAQAIEQNPQDANLHLLMGAMLYFDGEQQRSRLFFEQAAQLGANDAHLLDGFLAPAPADADQDDPAPGRANPGAARPVAARPGRADLSASIPRVERCPACCRRMSRDRCPARIRNQAALSGHLIRPQRPALDAQRPPEGRIAFGGIDRARCRHVRRTGERLLQVD